MKKIREIIGGWVGALIALGTLLIVLTLLYAILYPRYITKQKPVTYASKQECETTTQRTCMYAQCDYKCSTPYSGWMPVSKEK